MVDIILTKSIKNTQHYTEGNFFFDWFKDFRMTK
jgi:hypothetical protein